MSLVVWCRCQSYSDVSGGGVVLLVGVWSSVDGDDGDDGMVLWQGCSGVVGGGVLLLVVCVIVIAVQCLWLCLNIIIISIQIRNGHWICCYV